MRRASVGDSEVYLERDGEVLIDLSGLEPVEGESTFETVNPSRGPKMTWRAV
jgi:hypothetical protein